MINYQTAVLSILLAIPAAAQSSGVKEALDGLNSANVEARRAAITKFVNSLDNKETTEYGDDLVPVVEKAIADQDPEVRRQGFGALNLLSHVSLWSRKAGGKPVMGRKVNIDLSKSAKLKGLIKKGLTEENTETRGFAVSSLGLGFQPDKEIEDALVAKWKAESSPKVKRLVLEGLAAGKYSSEQTAEVVLAGLDEKNAGLRVAAAQVAGEIKIKKALPKIVNAVKTEKGSVRGDYAEAVAAFGPEAFQYESVLMNAAASEKDANMKARFTNAVKKIQVNNKDRKQP